MRTEQDLEEEEDDEEEEDILFITDPEVSNQLRREENAKKHALDFSQIERQAEPTPTIQPSKIPPNKMIEGIKHLIQQPLPHFKPEVVLPFACTYRYQFPILLDSQISSTSFYPRIILHQTKDQSQNVLNTFEGQYSPIHDQSTHNSLNISVQKVMNQFRLESQNSVEYHLKTKLKEKKRKMEEKKTEKQSTKAISKPVIEDDSFDIFEESGEYKNIEIVAPKQIPTQPSILDQELTVETINEPEEKSSTLKSKLQDYQFYEVYEEDEEDDDLLIQESKQKLLEDSWNNADQKDESKHSKSSSSSNKNKKKRAKIQQVEQILSKKSKHI